MHLTHTEHDAYPWRAITPEEQLHFIKQEQQLLQRLVLMAGATAIVLILIFT